MRCRNCGYRTQSVGAGQSFVGYGSGGSAAAAAAKAKTKAAQAAKAAGKHDRMTGGVQPPVSPPPPNQPPPYQPPMMPPTPDPGGSGGVTIQPVYPPGYQPPTRDPQQGGVHIQPYPFPPQQPPAAPPAGGGSGSVFGPQTGGGGTQPSVFNPQGSFAGQTTSGAAGWGGYAPIKNRPPDPTWAQWQKLSPFEQAAYRTDAMMAEPFEQTTDRLRHQWAAQGITAQPGMTRLSAAGQTLRDRMGTENTAEVFGQKPEEFWSDQSRVWQKANQSNVQQRA